MEDQCGDYHGVHCQPAFSALHRSTRASDIAAKNYKGAMDFKEAMNGAFHEKELFVQILHRYLGDRSALLAKNAYRRGDF